MSDDAVDFLVRRNDLSQVRWERSSEQRDRALDPDEVLLRVDRYSITANNITYGLVGELMHYWDFFPAPEGWGRLPVWGFADVVASRVPNVSEGDRFFGYWTMSTYVRLRAGRVSASQLIDASPHRSHLPGTYQQYQPTRRAEDPTSEDLRAIFGPVFATGFLIDDWLAEQAMFGAQQIVLSSASSKTAISAAFNLAQRSDRAFQLLGLTSPRNASFCERLGIYDRVLTYDRLSESSGQVPTVHVDMAGDAKLLAAVHHHFGANLRHSALVGFTHRGELASSGHLPGPKPEFFFAPTQVDKRQKDWGGEGLGQRIRDAQRKFYVRALEWLEIVHVRSRAEIEAAYADVLNGRIKASQAVMVLPSGS